MVPKCKCCNKNIGEQRVRYIAEYHIPIGKEWEGLQQGYEWIFVDAGMFCCQKCLFDYLKESFGERTRISEC